MELIKAKHIDLNICIDYLYKFKYNKFEHIQIKTTIYNYFWNINKKYTPDPKKKYYIKRRGSLPLNNKLKKQPQKLKRKPALQECKPYLRNEYTCMSVLWRFYKIKAG